MNSAQQSKDHLNYRPDIDGLRAVAVLLVLAFHLGINRVGGGYVGVDVFFVISGFLISTVILQQLGNSRFSLASFYERRIRRIFPALVVVLFATIWPAYRFMLPSEMVDYAKSFLAATFSFSNFYFLSQSGYFDAPASVKPLLHTWSLAVEEQFYIFLPLFLMAIRRFTPRLQSRLVVVVALASFIASIFGAYHSHDATFYLPHTRAWELLLGTLLAMDFFPELSSAIWRNILPFVGLTGIVAAGLLYKPATVFPGAAALLPCVGAALIIYSGKSGTSIVGRVLSLRPVVFIGLISYSLYLWHWPLIVFQNSDGLLLQAHSPRITKLTLIVVSLLLATLSWKFVEQPFRQGRLKLSRVAIFSAASVAALLALFSGSVILANQGFPHRYPAEAVQVATFLENTDAKTRVTYRRGTCFITSGETARDFNSAICLQWNKEKRNLLLMGDSHAAQLWYGLSQTYPDVNLMQATASGCKPTLDQSQSIESKCSDLISSIYTKFLPDHKVDALVLAARWDDGDISRLRQTLEWTRSQGIPVILFGPIVQYDSPLPQLLALSIKAQDPALPAEHRVAYYQNVDSEMIELARSFPNVRYVSFFRMLCPEGSCVEYANPGVPLQYDGAHLTTSGSLLVAAMLRSAGGLN